MTFMPLAGKGGERAKTFIDGVVYRLATAAVSAFLLISSPTLAEQHRLSIPMVIACILVVVLGVRLRPHYSQAVLDALRARRLDDVSARYLRDGLGKQAFDLVASQLRSDDPARLTQALRVARDLGIEVPQLDSLLVHENQAVVRAALSHLRASHQLPSHDVLRSMLDPKRPTAMLREVLKELTAEAVQDPQLLELVRPLTTHRDNGVATAACVLRLRLRGASAEARLDRAIASNRTIVGATGLFGRLTGVTRAGRFARDLNAVLDEDDVDVQLESIVQMGQLAMPAFFASLTDCLDHHLLRDAALQAMAGYKKRLPKLAAKQLGTSGQSTVARIGLLRAVERYATHDAIPLLIEHASDGEVRDHAIKALWRVTRNETLDASQQDALRALTYKEIARLACYQQTLTDLPEDHVRAQFVRAEVSARSVNSEMRAFRLLGMLASREAMQRAYIHYRSGETRARSNAIELLDQHLREPALRPFIQLIEKPDSGSDALAQSRDDTYANHAAEDMETHDPWLARCLAWQSEHRETPLDESHALDKLVLMRRGALLATVSGQHLLAIAPACNFTTHQAGERVISRGQDGDDLLLILEGAVAVSIRDDTHGDGRLAQLSTGACIGELSALDGGPRSAHVDATEALKLLHVPRAALHDLIELDPPILRKLIGLLTRRLREVIA
jgi:hypothetical protein